MNGNATRCSRFARPSSGWEERPVVHDVLVCDISGSMDEPAFEDCKTKRVIVDEALREFVVEKRDHRPQDYVAVVAYEDTATVCTDFVSVGTGYVRILSALDYMNRLSPGGTRMKRGFGKAAKVIRRKDRRDFVRMLAYSDGFDYDTSAAVRLAQEFKDGGVLIETFGVGRNPSDVDEDFLRAVATNTDGFIHYRFLGDGQTIRDTFSGLATGMLTFEE